MKKIEVPLIAEIMNNITNSIKTASEEATKEKKEILETKEFSEGLAAIRGADGR